MGCLQVSAILARLGVVTKGMFAGVAAAQPHWLNGLASAIMQNARGREAVGNPVDEGEHG